MKFYLTHLTFSDIQRSEYSAKTPADGAKMEFVGLNVPVMDMRGSAKPIGPERRNSSAIDLVHNLRPQEIVGKMPDYERGNLP